MIPCPYCDREFEKRAGLMRHVTASHHSEGAVPVNPGGALEAVVPVETEEQWLARRPWANRPEVVDPEVEARRPLYEESQGHLSAMQEKIGQVAIGDAESMRRYASTLGPDIATGLALTDRMMTTTTPVRIALDDGPELEATVGGPTPDEYKRIRALRREGHSEQVAWMTVLGQTPPERDAPPEDGRPLRWQQVEFRVKNGYPDVVDARWLLHLVELGAEAVALLDACRTDLVSEDALIEAVDRWNEAIR